MPDPSLGEEGMIERVFLLVEDGSELMRQDPPPGEEGMIERVLLLVEDGSELMWQDPPPGEEGMIERVAIEIRHSRGVNVSEPVSKIKKIVLNIFIAVMI